MKLRRERRENGERKKENQKMAGKSHPSYL
jgi:hypothetical protein